MQGIFTTWFLSLFVLFFATEKMEFLYEVLSATHSFFWCLWCYTPFLVWLLLLAWCYFKVPGADDLSPAAILVSWASLMLCPKPWNSSTNNRPDAVTFTTEDFFHLWFLVASPVIFKTVIEFPAIWRRLELFLADKFSRVFEVEIELSEYVVNCYKPTPPASPCDQKWPYAISDRPLGLELLHRVRNSFLGCAAMNEIFRKRAHKRMNRVAYEDGIALISSTKREPCCSSRNKRFSNKVTSTWDQANSDGLCASHRPNHTDKQEPRDCCRPSSM